MDGWVGLCAQYSNKDIHERERELPKTIRTRNIDSPHRSRVSILWFSQERQHSFQLHSIFMRTGGRREGGGGG
jgi:hypothetical protein